MAKGNLKVQVERSLTLQKPDWLGKQPHQPSIGLFSSVACSATLLKAGTANLLFLIVTNPAVAACQAPIPTAGNLQQCSG
jgi:hypothetical protein